ncbi:MAG: SPOR domain-containing protein [Gracilimonas sp.]
MKYLSLFIIVILAVACSTTEQTVEETMDEIKENYQDETTISGIDLKEFRTSLSDSYTYRENQIPEGFNRVKVQQEEEKDLYEGYRIQIFSGQDVTGADTTAANFRAWADTTIAGYQPETYVFFRTPYYRVHVGDFHEREKAIQFSNIVKRYFRDAWVVYDRVIPENVPADTTKIELK